MIGQHMYTRVPQGVFNKCAGYDTAAYSQGLNAAFIKGEIHPLCVHSGTENALTVAHFSDGQMFVGNAVHVPRDFSGARSAFFMHNFILGVNDARHVVDNIAEVFDVVFDTSVSADLPQLPALPLREGGRRGRYKFPQISGYIIESIEKAKKTYISVPREIIDNGCWHGFVREFIVHTFMYLPEWARHKLGFCTYSREVERRKGIHLVFMPEDSCGVVRGDFVVSAFCDDRVGEIPSFREMVLATRPAAFFADMEFWRMRLPYLCGELFSAEREWLSRYMDRFSVREFSQIPDGFFKARRGSYDAEIYLQLKILKQICVCKGENLEGILQNYSVQTATLCNHLNRLGFNFCQIRRS